MPLEFEQVRAAFHNAMPRRRDDFALAVADRLRAIAHEAGYVQKFPLDVLRIAETEMRARNEIAAQRIKQLLESGWKPTAPRTVTGAFIEMFTGFDDWQKDPSRDLYDKVSASFGNVGVHSPENETRNIRRLSQVQVQASNEQMSDLEVYAATYLDRTFIHAPSPSLQTTVEHLNQWPYDAFICHASEDKLPFVDELAETLRSRRLRIWFDRFTLTVGDGLGEKIGEGLRSSRYGIVVLSPAFFSKQWPRLELEGLFARQSADGDKVILPIWHGIDAVGVAQYSPLLAGRMATMSSAGIDRVVTDLLQAMRLTSESR